VSLGPFATEALTAERPPTPLDLSWGAAAGLAGGLAVAL
jgi:hypothetical protein